MFEARELIHTNFSWVWKQPSDRSMRGCYSISPSLISACSPAHLVVRQLWVQNLALSWVRVWFSPKTWKKSDSCFTSWVSRFQRGESKQIRKLLCKRSGLLHTNPTTTEIKSHNRGNCPMEEREKQAQVQTRQHTVFFFPWNKSDFAD